MENKCIHLSVAQLNGRELDFVRDAFESGWITTVGSQLDGFENDLQTYLQTSKRIVALSSGTAAIHLGLMRLGVSTGDEVICQDFTFAASVNPVKYLNASPVFVDSESETWNISPSLLKQAIEDRIKITGKKPKAIIFVDLYGMPAKISKIMEIADLFDIPVFEDAAEALGAFVEVGKKKQFCGTFGQYCCLSFNGNKIITTSGGGALICPDTESAEDVRFLATQARDQAPHYQHSRLGYNYRLSNICAAIGRGQMLSLQHHIDRRRAINQLYKKELGTLPELQFQEEIRGHYSNYWLTTVLFPTYEERECVRLYLESNNIESRPLWKPMHLQPLYVGAPFYGTGSNEMLFERGLCLPSGSGLTDEDIVYICNKIKIVYG